MEPRSSQPRNNQSQDVEVIDLTNDTNINNTTITLDDTHVDDDIESNIEANVETIVDCIDDYDNDNDHKDNDYDDDEDEDDYIKIHRSLSQQLKPSRPSDLQDENRTDISMSQPSPAKKLDSKEAKREAKRLKQLQKEQDKLVRDANRANTASRALENCTAEIHSDVLKLIGDSDEILLKTLFDESLIKYTLTNYPKIDNSIKWILKRMDVVDGQCVPKYNSADWVIVVMDGSDYLDKLTKYKLDPDDCNSIKSFLVDIRKRTECDVILMVYNLSNHLKTERAKEAKNYRKTFKDKFETHRPCVVDEQMVDLVQDTISPVLTLALTELQELRLTLQIDFDHEFPKWKFHLEFHEKTGDIITAIVKYTLSIAKLQVKLKNKESCNLGWAINTDKEKAIDPTRSDADLTRLWTSQLQQFHQVTLPVAKAITAEYPTPAALIDQYKMLTQDESEDLLAGLYVQRNMKRLIGSSISKRIHCFMTCRDPDVHLGLS